MFERSIRASLALAAWVVASAAAPVNTTTVAVSPDGSPATVTGAVDGYKAASYTFDASAGQNLSVRLLPSNPLCYFTLWKPEPDQVAHIGSTAGNEFEDIIKADGTYRIQVFLTGNAARRHETCSYTLKIALRAAASK